MESNKAVNASKKSSEMNPKERFRPEPQEYAQQAMAHTVIEMKDALYKLDRVIRIHADLLYRAQPFLSGRIVINFLRDSSAYKLLLDGKQVIDVRPVPGLMLRTVSGKWFLKKIRKLKNGKWQTVGSAADALRNTQMDSLADYRVGRSYRENDRLAKRLLDDIEEMLLARENMMNSIMQFRKSSVQLRQRAIHLRDNSFVKLENYEKRLRTDWKDDFEGSIQYYKKQAEIRREKRKLGKMDPLDRSKPITTKREEPQNLPRY